MIDLYRIVFYTLLFRDYGDKSVIPTISDPGLDKGTKIVYIGFFIAFCINIVLLYLTIKMMYEEYKEKEED